MSNVPTPAYLLVQVKVKNHKEYMQGYGKFVIAMFEKIGVQVVALVADLPPRIFGSCSNTAIASCRPISSCPWSYRIGRGDAS